MKNGTVSEHGTYQELLEKKGAFAEFLVEYMTEQGHDLGEDLKEDLQAVVGTKDIISILSKSNSTETKDRERGSSVSNSEKIIPSLLKFINFYCLCTKTLKETILVIF